MPSEEPAEEELPELPLDGTIEPWKAKAVAAENAALKALRQLGERSEGEVRGILGSLESATESRRRRIEAFAGQEGELQRIDELRKGKMEDRPWKQHETAGFTCVLSFPIYFQSIFTCSSPGAPETAGGRADGGGARGPWRRRAVGGRACATLS